MYADELTDSMEKAISETNRRRKIQMQYNEEHGITPQTIQNPSEIPLKQVMLLIYKKNTSLIKNQMYKI